MIERVLNAAKQLDFKPNYWARTLSMKETRIIGLTMLGEQTKFSQFHLNLMNGVLRVCYEQGYRLLVNTLAAEQQRSFKHWTTDPVDGEIMLDPELDDQRLQRRSPSGPPLVIVGRPAGAFEGQFCCVDNDNTAIAEQVTQYLFDLGHQDILLLNTSRDRTVAVDRLRGYENVVVKAGRSVDQRLCVFKDPSIPSVEYGYQSIHEIWSSGTRFSAVIADSDKVALGVYRAAMELGLSIPGHISIFAFSDDSVFAPEFHPPLSGVSLNAETLGSEAANLLIERIKDNTAPVLRKIVPTSLVIRASCSFCNSNQ